MGKSLSIRIKITPEHAEAILAKLPGGRAFYLRIADAFLRRYQA